MSKTIPPQKQYFYTNNRWNELDLKSKSSLIQMAVRNGVYNIEDIRNMYDSLGQNTPTNINVTSNNGVKYADGGPIGKSSDDNYNDYFEWLQLLADKKSKEWNEPYSYILMDMLNSNEYDYKAFYDENPQRAWDYLNSEEGTHFDDVGKTVYHPSFSNESMYSANNYGDMDTGANPNNIVGPTWNDDNQLIDSDGNVVFDENQYAKGGNTSPDNPPVFPWSNFKTSEQINAEAKAAGLPSKTTIQVVKPITPTPTARSEYQQMPLTIAEQNYKDLKDDINTIKNNTNNDSNKLKQTIKNIGVDLFKHIPSNEKIKLIEDLHKLKEYKLPDLNLAAHYIGSGYKVEYNKKADDENMYFSITDTNDPFENLNSFVSLINDYYNYKNNNINAKKYKSNNLGEIANDIFEIINPIPVTVRPFDETKNGIFSQLYRWYDRKFNKSNNIESQLSNEGTDIVNLGNNVIRLTPTSKQATALFNEFVETKNPSIYKASDYKQGKIKNFSDKNIPIENISLFQGVQNGHYKVGNINDFDDTTLVFPVRNIKKEFSAPIKNITISGKNKISNNNRINIDDFYDQYKTQLRNKIPLTRNDIINKLINTKYSEIEPQTQQAIRKELEKIPENFFLKVYNNITDDNIDDVLVDLSHIISTKHPIYSKYPDYFKISNWDLHSHLFDSHKEKIYNELKKKYSNYFKITEDDEPNVYTVTDINNKTYPISNLNAAVLDNKTILGNNSGGLFIGGLGNISQEQLERVNKYLEKNPSWLIRNDLGSFDTYDLNNPSLKKYLKQYYEHPSENDPNVFVIGTTLNNKFKNGGIINTK